MSEPETITLPRSGLVLTKTSPRTFRLFDTQYGLEELVRDGAWLLIVGDRELFYPAQDLAEEALDRMLLALRSALLPPDAVVVRTGDARERVEKATSRWFGVWGRHERDRCIAAVLAALGIGGKACDECGGRGRSTVFVWLAEERGSPPRYASRPAAGVPVHMVVDPLDAQKFQSKAEALAFTCGTYARAFLPPLEAIEHGFVGDPCRKCNGGAS